jgi:large subunit ribosomal protein L17
MTDTARRYQAGYRDSAAGDWIVGLPPDDLDAETGYYDVELEIWVLGEPGILSGEWMPDDAVLATGEAECPVEYPVKGNLPSRVYHLPDDATYARTIPEICFADADAAMMAGFRPSRARKRHE